MKVICNLLFTLAVIVVTANAQAETLKVTSIINEPFLTRGKNGFQGYCYDLAKEISARLDMNMSINLVKDGKYGVLNSDGKWEGIVGEIIRGEADVAIAPLTVTAERESVVDFTKPFMLAELAFVHKKPSRLDTTPDVVINMFSVFNFGVWALLLISIILVTVGLWAIAFFISDEDFSQVGTTIDYIMSTLLFLTPKVRPTSPLLRAYSYLWLILRLTIFLIFLVYFLQFSAVQRLSPQNLSSFEDLSNRLSAGHQYNILFVSGGSTEGKFARSNYDVYARIYNAYSQSEKRATSSSEGIKLVQTDAKNVFIGEAPMLKYIASQPPCDMYMSEYQKVSMQPVSNYALAVQKNSPLLGKISDVLKSMTESGFLIKLENKWFESNQCAVSDAQNSQNQGLTALTVVVARSFFLLVLVLILYAIGVFIYTRLSGIPVGNVQTVDASDKDSAQNKVPEIKLEEGDGKEEAT